MLYKCSLFCGIVRNCIINKWNKKETRDSGIVFKFTIPKIYNIDIYFPAHYRNIIENISLKFFLYLFEKLYHAMYNQSSFNDTI